MARTTGHDLPALRCVGQDLSPCHRLALKNQEIGTAKLTPYQISPAEMKVLLDGFSDPNPLYGSGFHVDGVKYTVIGATDKTIRGKHVSAPLLTRPGKKKRRKEGCLAATGGHSEETG
jgi:hypothetical protein